MSGGIVQIAYAVADVRVSAAAHAARHGSGPWYVAEHIELERVDRGGRPAVFHHSSAFGQWGAVMAELICVHDTEPESLAEAVGGAGVHHVARFADDLDRESTRLAATGCPQVMEATTSSGLRFAFHASPDLPHLLEIYEDSPPLRRFYAAVAATADAWDGSEPVRELAALGRSGDIGRSVSD